MPNDPSNPSIKNVFGPKNPGSGNQKQVTDLPDVDHDKAVKLLQTWLDSVQAAMDSQNTGDFQEATFEWDELQSFLSQKKAAFWEENEKLMAELEGLVGYGGIVSDDDSDDSRVSSTQWTPAEKSRIEQILKELQGNIDSDYI